MGLAKLAKHILFFSLVFAFGLFSQPMSANLRQKARKELKTNPSSLRVQAEILINGKVISSPSVVAIWGERALISAGQTGAANPDLHMEVLAQPADERFHEVLLDLDLKFKLGERAFRSSPQVYVKPGERAVLTLEESSAQEKIQLRILTQTLTR